MGIHLKDIIEVTCRKAEQDGNGKNIDATYQKKLGIGTFTGNIDWLGDGGLPYTSSICWCQSNVVEGTLPYESSNACWFVLETNIVLDDRTIRSQRATVYDAAKTRLFERLHTNGEWLFWEEIVLDRINFVSDDKINPTTVDGKVDWLIPESDKKWHILKPLAMNGKFIDHLASISTLFHNVRYLYKMLGTTDISKIADGTLTGIVSALNTDKTARSWKTSTVSFVDCTKTGYLYGEERFLDYFVVPKVSLPENLGKFVSFVGTSYNGPMYCALTMIHGNGNHYGGIVFSYDPACTARQFRYSSGKYGFRTI